ncbi:MAG: hypothetical protein EPN76_08315 [Burkholderiaceae bacterium]|nr:MAG: hypothetical protein EPN76_08315 [Burkholderiaceae bacterium]
MQRSLAFENSPPLLAPLPFFLNVPLFAALAALLLLWEGPQALVSRWSPLALALTHLFTLGVLTSAMTGALIQILPVATGVHIPNARTNAGIVHALLTLGTLALAAAFMLSAGWIYRLALTLLAAAFAWFIIVCIAGFWQCRRTASTRAAEVLLAVRLGLAALFVTVVLGVTLAGGLGWGLSRPFALLPFGSLVDLHGLWGLAGWVGLVIAGIAYQVMPIFQVTELYPRRFTQWFAPGVFVLLVLWSVVAFVPGSPHAANRAVAALVALGYVALSVTTFHLLWTRKRRKADTTTLFWRCAMVSLSCCVLVWFAQWVGGVRDFSVTLGVLFVVGVALSAINGMLYKIIPFLLWYNAEKTLELTIRIVPKVQNIIPDSTAAKQFWAHLAALVLLVAASFWPVPFTRVAAVALAISVGWLGRNMFNAIRLYRRVRRQIDEIQADPARANEVMDLP